MNIILRYLISLLNTGWHSIKTSFDKKANTEKKKLLRKLRFTFGCFTESSKLIYIKSNTNSLQCHLMLRSLSQTNNCDN